MGADPLIAARERHGIGPIGPRHRDRSWRGLAEGAFDAAGFALDRGERAVRRPEGKRSASRASRRNTENLKSVSNALVSSHIRLTVPPRA